MPILGALVAVLLAGWAHTAHAEDTSSIGYASVAEAFEALRADPNAQISTHQGWTIVSQETEGQSVLWSFTPASHPAHPATVKRTVFEKDGAIYIDMTALCQADKASCDELVEQFRELNERIRQSFSSGK